MSNYTTQARDDMPLSDSYILRLRKIVGSQVLLARAGRAILEDSAQKILLIERTYFGFWRLFVGL